MGGSARRRCALRDARDDVFANGDAANSPTISWFNSSPDWKLVHDAKIDGTWLWVKE